MTSTEFLLFMATVLLEVLYCDTPHEKYVEIKVVENVNIEIQYIQSVVRHVKMHWKHSQICNFVIMYYLLCYWI